LGRYAASTLYGFCLYSPMLVGFALSIPAEMTAEEHSIYALKLMIQ